MKFGAKPRKDWSSSAELNGKFNRLNKQINRLMLLDHVWTELVADKAQFWKLVAVQ